MAMDKVLEKKKRPLWQVGALLVGVGAIAYGAFQLLSDASIRTYRVSADQLIVSTVQQGAFEDLIPIRGTIQPFESVFLDAVIGGSVDEVFVEEGAFVDFGQPLVQLSNTATRLNAAQADAQTTEQLNNLTNITNNFEYQRLATERQIIDTEFRIVTLERQKGRFEQLVGDSLISEEEYEAIVDELDYQTKVLSNLKARQIVEDREREARLEQIANQIDMLSENLEISQASFESLLVKAPISGQLTSFPVEIGESKQTGQRLGQIDVVDQYKIVAQIDEFYVSRVAPLQSATFTLAGQEYHARVDKVYPEITAGTFEVDMIFEGATPTNVRRGQTLQMELTLGNPVESLLLPVGGFIQDTGGNWVFVLDASGETAIRRDIRVGRRNNRFVEVQEGLREGERVITSGYGQMEDVERVQLIL
ncbi:MAG: efflux RND transporter periplasmic adaptor subunit [Pseudomonadales bacterium]|nr:efflux RND transporter periplasmic adaptor subunit [Pseudomonadales bacterium]